MEKISTLNLTFDRVVIQLITPGLIAAYPFIILFFDEIPDARDFFLKDSNGLFLAFLILIGLIAGIVLENFGSRIEVWIYDVEQSKIEFDYFIIWNKFLQLTYDSSEPVGDRYLRNILLRMKFEVSTGAALVFMVIGLAIWNYRQTIFHSFFLNLFIVYLLPLSVSLYLILYEGRSSSRILAKTRRLLVDKYYK